MTDSTTNKPVIKKKGRGAAQFLKGWGIGKKFEATLDKHSTIVGPEVNQYKLELDV